MSRLRDCSRQASAERYDFWRWDCTEKVCSQRCTVVLEIPVTAAREQALQRALPRADRSALVRQDHNRLGARNPVSGPGVRPDVTLRQEPGLALRLCPWASTHEKQQPWLQGVVHAVWGIVSGFGRNRGKGTFLEIGPTMAHSGSMYGSKPFHLWCA
jgi:hypothetical protein